MTLEQTHAGPDPFDFDLPEDLWLERLRRAQTPPDQGWIGEYRLESEIGRGGQGVVFRARQPRTGRLVALKCLPGWGLAGAGARERFEREIEAVCKLSHPGIVTVHGVETVSGQPVLAMELVDGEAIDRWAAASSKTGLHVVLAVFVQACEAVAHAHRRGIIHRDLKPSNILVDVQGRARVLDFGLARQLDGAAPASIPTGFVGTPEYSSPEQLAGASAVDTRTDIYSLGVVLYQMVTGISPLGAATLAEVFARVREGRVTPPSRVGQGVARDLDSIILKAMAPEPSRRYGTVDALIDDVRRFLAGLPVSAHPPTFRYRAGRAVRRRPVTAAATVAAVAGLVGLTLTSGILSIRLESRGNDLEIALDDAERAARSSEAAVSLLNSMLESVQLAVQARSSADPVRSVLINACERLEAGEFAGDPEAQLRLWRTVALIASRWDYVVILDRAVQSARPLVGLVHDPRSQEAAFWAYQEAYCADARRDFDTAERLYTEIMAVLRGVGGDQSELFALTAHSLAAIQMIRGNYEQADAMFLSALDVRTRIMGDPSPAVARTLGGLAELRRRQNRLEEAAAFAARAEATAEASCEILDPRRIRVGVTVGQVMLARGDVAGAEAHWWKLIHDLEPLVSPESPLLMRPLAALMDSAAAAGRIEEAVGLSERLARVEAGPPFGGRRRAELLLIRAGWLAELGRHAEAGTALSRAHELASGLSPPDPDLLTRISAALEAAAVAPSVGSPDEERP